jgi:hypothetical protein
MSDIGNNAPPQKLPLTLRWDNGVLLPISEVDAAERETIFRKACIDTALSAAKNGTAIQKQRRLEGWVIQQIERDASFRPKERQIKAGTESAKRGTTKTGTTRF